MVKPRERFTAINRRIQLQLGEKKERDRHWEYMVENPCHPMPIPYAQRFHNPSRLKSVTKPSADEEEAPYSHQSVRMHLGREVDYSSTDTPMSGHRCSGWRRGLYGHSAVIVDEDASSDTYACALQIP
ncbi:hypothetical protein JAAARDRAFT_40030 [Jaapia argillacea MUCL 33604]|uniref:Uncharacterized protein n=1 Tax=Jaapia argillacea MUCL 33604 TaxID=933084 RepID=A0A067PN55_9AGAM|nr:hypothetical protein JAAARDRAFT_40030 [Jaapia argillacea MUCL 33604]